MARITNNKFRFLALDWTWASVLVIAAVILRCLPWHHVFEGGNVYFYDYDSYARLRKILIYLYSFPLSSFHDYYQGFPVGTGIITPPVIEYVSAALLLPFRSIQGLDSLIPFLMALVSPLVAGVTVFFLYRFLRNMVGILPAVAGTLVLVLHPIHADTTVLGRFDNEMLETLFFLFVCVSYIGTLQIDVRSSPWLRTAAASVIFLFVWRGAIVMLCLIAIDIFMRVTLPGDTKDIRLKTIRQASLMYFGCTVVLALVCISDIWGTRAIISFNIISWFHVIIAAAAAILLALWGGVLSRGRKPLTSTTIFGSLILLIVIAGLSTVGSSLLQGLKVVGGGNHWIDSIQQYRKGDVTSLIVFILLTPLAYFLPSSFLDRGLRRFLSILLCWTFALFCLKVRFAHFAILSMSIVTAISISSLACWSARNRSILSRTAVPLVIFVLLVTQTVSVASYFMKIVRYDSPGGGLLKGDRFEAMEWLKLHTPVVGDYFRPFVKPDYGICSRWEYGALIETLAQRPSIATHFGTEAPGMNLAGKILTQNDNTLFLETMDANKIRYLVLDKISNDLTMYSELAGSPRLFFRKTYDRRGKSIDVPLPTYLELVSTRLFLADGCGTSVQNIAIKPVDGMRLVYESSSTANMLAPFSGVRKIKIFERVNATKHIRVNGRPRSPVTMTQEFESNQGRRFLSRRETFFNNEGVADFPIIYKPKVTRNETGAVGLPLVQSEGISRKIQYPGYGS